jgi:hypothetical protein
MELGHGFAVFGDQQWLATSGHGIHQGQATGLELGGGNRVLGHRHAHT